MSTTAMWAMIITSVLVLILMTYATRSIRKNKKIHDTWVMEDKDG